MAFFVEISASQTPKLRKLKSKKKFHSSADIDQIYENEKDPEKPNIENGATEDIEENTGFAIVVNGHSLVYCLSSELENR